jgi:hypothetical protein
MPTRRRTQAHLQDGDPDSSDPDDGPREIAALPPRSEMSSSTKYAPIVAMYARMLATSIGVQILALKPTDVRRIFEVRPTRTNRFMLAPRDADPLARELLRGLIELAGPKEARELELVGTSRGSQTVLDMSVWLSIYTMCFLPRGEAPEDATLLFAFDVQRERTTDGKLVGFLSMCRTVAPAKEAAYEALTVGKIAEAVGDDERRVASRVLVDTVMSSHLGVGEALVVAALAAVMRARKTTHGVYAVAVSIPGGRLFSRLGFERLDSRSFAAPRGVYHLAKSAIDVARFQEGRLPTKMTAAVCTRRGVRDPTQVIARC